MTIHAILWDMDGVLIDTTDAHYEAWRAMAAERNIQLDRQRFLGCLGMNNVSAIEYIFGQPPSPQEVIEIGGRKEALFRKILGRQAKLLPGVQEWLSFFKLEGYPQAVATSAPWENIDALLAVTGIRDIFDTVISAYDKPGKPDPYVFLEASRKVGVAPADCLVIEDSLIGIEAARRGGMKCLAVATTYPIAKLEKADWVLHRLSSQRPQEFIRRANKK
jgi:HAD superfamily hydrolase (TIGR01509 family)